MNLQADYLPKRRQVYNYIYHRCHRLGCKLFIILAGIYFIGLLMMFNIEIHLDSGITRLSDHRNYASMQQQSQKMQRLPNMTIDEKDIFKYLIPYNCSGCQKNKCSFIILEGAPPIPYYHDENNPIYWPQFSTLFAKLLGISPGGEWQPDDCISQFWIVMIVPIQNRESNLREFLLNMHPFLQRQNIRYRIYAIELASNLPWNKGILLNAGFIEAMKDNLYPCVILHDVDMIPIYRNNIYACTNGFRQMVVYRYNSDGSERLFAWWNGFALEGGAIALLSDHYKLINGFSNKFFGWGREDQDFVLRAENMGLQIVRYHENISQYYQLPHRKSRRNLTNDKILRDGEHFYHEGLNTTQYIVVGKVNEPLCTRIIITYPLR